MEKKDKIIYALAVLGIVISIYLTISKYDSSVLACPEGGLINCESVITSSYSSIFGIPTSVLAVVLFILAPYMIKKNDTYAFLWSVAGAAAVLYSVGAMSLLGKICIYCSSLDVIIIILIYIANFTKPKANA